jgi:sarcosine oxidase, subunit gamma
VTAECAPLDNVIRAGAPEGPSGVSLTDRRFVGQVNLRVRGSALDPAGHVLGYALPTTPNTTATNGSSTTCWCGPDEWLIVLADGDQAQLIQRFGQSLAGHAHAATDVTDARAVLRLVGACARFVLGKGCPIDLHPRAFGPGKAAQTLIGRSQALILPIDEGYDVFVPRSFAGYLWTWLLDAGAEFGLRAEQGPPRS